MKSDKLEEILKIIHEQLHKNIEENKQMTAATQSL